MSTYIHKVTPFVYLSHALRQASVPDACRIFMAIGELASAGESFWWPRDLTSSYSRPKSVLKKRFLSSEQGMSSSHEQLDFDKLHQFVSSHIQDVDSPQLMMHANRCKSRGEEEWIVRCAIHPDVGEDGELRRLWLPHLEQQPNYAPGLPWECFSRAVAHAMESDPMTTASIGLQNAFQAFTVQRNCSEIEILTLMQEYTRLGTTAALVWQYQWREYGILRGQSLPNYFQEIHEVLRNINEEFSNSLADWCHPLPVQVRRKLAKVNFEGEFLYLLNHVFPQMIAPEGSTIREDEFPSAFQR